MKRFLAPLWLPSPRLRPWFSVPLLCLMAVTLSATAPTQPPAPAPAWVPLFDGHSLAGWKVRSLPADADQVFWTVRDGAIECDTPARQRGGSVWLLHDSEWADFELELEFQAFRSSKGNSGVQIRSRYDASPTAPNGGQIDGPQIDIHPPAPFRTGLIYDETRTEKRWIFPSLPSPKIEPRPDPAGFTFHYAEDAELWNRLRIIARGPTIKTELNGVVIADYDGAGLLDNAAHRQLNVGLSGQIALQLHARDELKIRYRALRIRALPGPSP